MLRVTEHAINRLYQRGRSSSFVASLCAEKGDIRAAVAARLERAAGAAMRLGLSRYHITLNGLRFVVCDGAIVTVLHSEATHSARKNGIARG